MLRLKDKRLLTANTLIAKDLESIFVGIALSYLTYSFIKGDTLSEALDQLNLKLPSNVEDNWNQLDLEMIAEITIMKKQVKISRKTKLQAFFTVDEEDDYDA